MNHKNTHKITSMEQTKTKQKIKLGCIADDFTGATDLANNLVRAGMRVSQTIGIPQEAFDLGAEVGVDAIVVALKTRSIPAADAVSQSLAALAWLREQGAEQIYFKYCSTFDSTPTGNIGPVAQALMQALDTSFSIATPAFPDNHRTVFKGHLFVGDVLLSDSGMRNHPLTPMTDANLVRVLQAQSTCPISLIDYKTVASGETAIRSRIAHLQAEGVGMAIVDAVSNDDLMLLGPALRGMPLVTGGSGVAIGLPQNWGLAPNPSTAQLPPSTGRCAVVSGSCSLATNAQVAHFKAQGLPAFALDASRLASGAPVVQEALTWAQTQNHAQPVLIYSTADPAAVQAVQSQLGVDRAGAMLEDALAQIACGLVDQGVRQLIVAGGETSGACTQALGIKHMQIGPQIDPGVPWCYALGSQGNLHLALKSGNFGTADFMTKVFKTL
jgi:3-dehydrotetronate 4-kinase